MKPFRLIFLLLCIGLLTSCGKYNEIEIVRVSDIQIKGFDDNALQVSLKLDIDNPSLHRIKISDMDTRLFLNGGYIGKIATDTPVVLKPRSNESYPIDLRIRLANFIGTAMQLMALKTGQQVQIRLEGTVTAKTWMMKKTIAVNESRQIVI